MNRPRPVLTAAGISGAITSVASVLTFLGYNEAAAHLSAMTSTIVSVALGLVLLASHILPALHAQAKVTPVDKPQDAAGNALVPATASIALTAAAPLVGMIGSTDVGISDEPDPDPELDDEPETVHPADEPHLVQRLGGAPVTPPLVTGTAAPVQTPHASEHAASDQA